MMTARPRTGRADRLRTGLSLGGKELSVLIPTYEEAENLPELAKALTEALPSSDFEVILIDDNSRDGTAEIAQGLARIHGNIRSLLRPRRLGLASAVLDGLKAANGGIIAVMDADLQHPPGLLPAMLAKVKDGCDLVVASRYIDGGRVEGWSLGRRLLSHAAVGLAHVLLPRTRRLKDPVSGYFMFRESVLGGVELKPIGYKLLAEMLVKGRYSSVAEVPYTFRPRLRGRSKLGLREICSYVRQVSALSMGV